jgi:hypothetical protein
MLVRTKSASQNGALRTTLFEPFEILVIRTRKVLETKRRTASQDAICEFGSSLDTFRTFLGGTDDSRPNPLNLLAASVPDKPKGYHA